MKIDIKPIQAELAELAGNAVVRVRLDKSIDVASSIRQYEISKKGKSEIGFDIKLNPNRFHSAKKLQEHINFLREDVGYG